MPGAFYYRGWLGELDTYGQNKNLGIVDADTGNSHAFTGGPAPGVVNHAGQTQKEYAFTTPFVAHLIRDVPGDQVPWRKFGIIPVGEQWPELTAEASPWLSVRGDKAAWLQGFI